MLLLVLSPEESEVVVDPCDEPWTQLVVKHELMDNLDLLLEGHSVETQD